LVASLLSLDGVDHVEIFANLVGLLYELHRLLLLTLVLLFHHLFGLKLLSVDIYARVDSDFVNYLLLIDLFVNLLVRVLDLVLVVRVRLVGVLLVLLGNALLLNLLLLVLDISRVSVNVLALVFHFGALLRGVAAGLTLMCAKTFLSVELLMMV